MPKKVFAKCVFGFQRDIVVEDEVNAVVDFGDGVTGHFLTSTSDLVGTDRLEILCDQGKVVVEDSSTVTITRLTQSERELSDNAGMDFVRELFTGKLDRDQLMSVETREYSSVWGEQHAEVLRNFAAAVESGGQLLAPAADGIHGVRLANAMHLSSWLDREVSIEDFDEDAYLVELNRRIAAEGLFPQREE